MPFARIESRAIPAGSATMRTVHSTLLICFLAFVLLFGGASRADALSQAVVRGGAIAFGAAALLMAHRSARGELGPALAFMGAMALVMLLQLVPLPPFIWQALPGREVIADGAIAAGIPQPWRPTTMAPDATMNSVMALLPAVAAALVVANTDNSDGRLVTWSLLLMIIASAILGLAQLTTQYSFLFFYAITNYGEPVGFFANRNHQALFLALAFPVIATLVAMELRNRKPNHTLIYTLCIVALFLVPLVFASGSRAGLVLALLGIGGGALLIRSGQSRSAGTRSRTLPARSLAVGGGVIALVLLAASYYFARGASLERFFIRDLNDDRRLTAIDPTLEIIRDTFPFGTGFGSFPHVFRIYEPFDMLSVNYWNHAHSDALEIVVEGGIFAAILLVAFMLWLGAATRYCWRRRGPDMPLLSRLATVIVAMILLASLVDYPVRTPIFAVLLAICCVWIRRGAPSGRGAGGSGVP